MSGRGPDSRPKSMKTGRDHFLSWVIAVIPLLAVLAIVAVGLIRNLRYRRGSCATA